MIEENCKWIKVEDMWETECNLLWLMSNDNDLTENDMNYCPKCGKKIKEKKTMENKTIITTDGKEQGWIDTFNEYNHTNYKLNQEIEPSQIEQLNDKVIAFNNMIAFGPAIQLEVIQS